MFTLTRLNEHRDKSTSWERLRGLSYEAYPKRDGFGADRGGPLNVRRSIPEQPQGADLWQARVSEDWRLYSGAIPHTSQR